MRVTSGSWDGEKVILRDQVLEVRNVDGGLVVPFDCPLETLRAEAEKAVRVLAKELESATIQGP
jgi:hypothetical protein